MDQMEVYSVGSLHHHVADLGTALNIRLAHLGDLDSVKSCAEEAYALYVPRIGKNPAPMVADFRAQIEAGHNYVIEAGGDVAGFIVLYRRRDQRMLRFSPRVNGRDWGERFCRLLKRKPNDRTSEQLNSIRILR